MKPKHLFLFILPCAILSGCKKESSNEDATILRKKYWLLSIVIITFSCTAKREITGTYQSNFAQFGFFVTQLSLLPNGHFSQTFSGDLIHRLSEGTYRIDGNRLILDYKRKSVDPTMEELMKAAGSNSLIFEIDSGANDTLLIRQNKLLHISGGRTVRKAQRYNKLKRFIIFGSHYYRRKYYLRKVS